MCRRVFKEALLEDHGKLFYLTLCLLQFKQGETYQIPCNLSLKYICNMAIYIH